MSLKLLPNGLTMLRIAGSVYLAFAQPLSLGFYICYVLCGVSDMLDGFLARRLDAQSSVGAALDSGADAVFAAVCLIRLLPIFGVPSWVWLWTAAIFAVKLVSLTLGYVKCGRIGFPHTSANKLMGFFLFLSPFIIPFADKTAVFTVLCAVATLAAADELRRVGK